MKVTVQREQRWDPSVSFRLPKEDFEAIDTLRPSLGGVENATRSATVRELVRIALIVINPRQARRVSLLAARRQISSDEAWRLVAEQGLAQLESEEPTP
jgi:hypothetical protein